MKNLAVEAVLAQTLKLKFRILKFPEHKGSQYQTKISAQY